MEKVLVQEKVVRGTPEEIWSLLSDTAELNRRLSLAEMTFETVQGVRVGKQKSLGFDLVWTEAPWEWKQNAWLKNKRVYSKGFFRSLEGYFQILTQNPNESLVRMEFRIHHRFPWLSPLFNFGAERVLKGLLQEVSLGQKTFPLAPKGLQKFSTFKDWLSNSTGVERARISPKMVAREIGTTWETIFEESVTGELKSRLSLRFDAVCPHCRGAKKSAPCLTEIPEKVLCDSCEISFPTGTQESIEISLKDSQLSEKEASTDFCSADVTHKPTIVFQRVLDHWSEELFLPAGVYLLKKRGVIQPFTIVTDPGHHQTSLRLNDLSGKPSTEPLKLNPNFKLTSDSSDPRSLLMIEAVDKFRGALLATEVVLHPELSRFIPEGVLKSDFSMEVGSRALMFTDVVGSTELYHKIGDGEAFRLVRESFLYIGEIARRHRGVLVKTIGDATMYTFPTMDLACQAAMELQEKNGLNTLKLRASLHFGPCLSVGTKSGVDFFGDAVNICAKFQSEAETGQIVFEESLIHLLTLDSLKSLVQKSERVPIKLKGESQREFTLRRLTLS